MTRRAISASSYHVVLVDQCNARTVVSRHHTRSGIQLPQHRACQMLLITSWNAIKFIHQGLKMNADDVAGNL
jgi:hypothetical protein